MYFGGNTPAPQTSHNPNYSPHYIFLLKLALESLGDRAKDTQMMVSTDPIRDTKDAYLFTRT
jgi:hypothetical protein